MQKFVWKRGQEGRKGRGHCREPVAECGLKGNSSGAGIALHTSGMLGCLTVSLIMQNGWEVTACNKLLCCIPLPMSTMCHPPPPSTYTHPQPPDLPGDAVRPQCWCAVSPCQAHKVLSLTPPPPLSHPPADLPGDALRPQCGCVAP
jgi:hypothetical protein